MDTSAVNHNVTVDDFDSILTFKNQADWTTPDPSATGYRTDGSPWLRATYHNTTVKGAEVSLSFTGPAVYVYGAEGPPYGAFEIEIDGQYTYEGNAYRDEVFEGARLLFFATNLIYGNHELVIRNTGRPKAGPGGSAFALDYIQTTFQLAPPGATVTNVTFEETDPAIKYSGEWGSNKGSVFSGGGTTYTNADGGSLEFTFQGSALYILGDKKNDHRAYTVTLDSQPAVTYNGTSGCGGTWGLTCEQQLPCIKFLATNLGEGNHTVKLVNNANGAAQNGEQSYFDLDSIVVTVPSVYAPRQLSDRNSSPFVPGSSSILPGPSGAGSPSGAAPSGSSTPGLSGDPNTGAAHRQLEMMSNPLLLVFGLFILLRTWKI